MFESINRMIESIKGRQGDPAIHIVEVIIGLCLILSPWVLGYAKQTPAAWSAWLTGAAMILIGLGAVIKLAAWEEWVNLLLGLWAVAAPWILSFSMTAAAAYTHVMAGLIVFALAVVELWSIKRGPLSTA